MRAKRLVGGALLWAIASRLVFVLLSSNGTRVRKAPRQGPAAVDEVLSLDLPPALLPAEPTDAETTSAGPDGQVSGGPAVPDRSPVRTAVAACLIALAAAGLAAALVAPQPLRAILVLAAMVGVPGGAIAVRTRSGDAATAVGLAVALGIAVDIIVGLGMVWTGWWHPAVAAAVVGGLSTLSLLPDLRGPVSLPAVRIGPLVRAALYLLPAVAAAGLWLFSVRRGVDLTHLDGLGLPAGLPATWYVALVISLAGAVVLIATRSSGILIAVYVAAATMIMYATLPALTHVPVYAWTYKHIGVTSLVEHTGTVHPNLDLYGRWPGFFAAAAAFARLAGVAPVAFAGWFEPLFAALDVLLVAALARALTGRARVAAWAALLFAVCNYVGQDYYSPQAMTYVLALAALVLVLRQCSDPNRVNRWIGAVAARADYRGRSGSPIERLPMSPVVSLGLIVLLQAAIVATHQLTPYMLALQVGVLTVIGITRPRWLFVVLAGMAIAYLIPNLGFIRQHYGLFHGFIFDPVGNAHVFTISHGLPWGVINGGGTISELLSVLALICAVGLARAGHGRAVAILLALAAAPFVILLAQSYGGEASLRVFLFSSPWRVILVAWGLGTLRPRWAMLAGLAAVAAFAALWLPTFLGRAQLDVMPRGEVAAADAFYARAPAGSLLTLSAPNFPTRGSARYAAMARPDLDVDLTLVSHFRGRRLGASDIGAVIYLMHKFSRSDFLVFSTTESRYAVLSGRLPVGSLASLERAVAASSRFRLWYSNRDARIYRLVAG